MPQRIHNKVIRRGQRVLRRLQVGLILLLIVVVAAVVVQLVITRARNTVSHSFELERNGQAIGDAIRRASSNKVGFLLTKSDWLYEGFLEARDSLRPPIERLRALSEPIPEERNRLAPLLVKLQQFSDSLDRQIEQLDRGEYDQVTSGLSDSAYQGLVLALRDDLFELKAQREAQVRAERETVSSLTTLSSLLYLIGAVGLVFILVSVYRNVTPLIEELSTANVNLRQQQADTEQLVQTLQNKNLELDRFAAIAAHDLQEPLRTVTNFVEVFDEEYADKLGEEATTYFSFIYRATDRMRQLIDNLRAYSQIGRLQPVGEVDLNDLINELRRDFQSDLEDTGGKLDIQASLPTVTGYSTELYRLFRNLISNALKFSRPGVPPTIVVSCEEDEHNYYISVADNGRGISEAQQRKIFGIFNSLNDPDTTTGGGIGLAFCRKIVELHRGSLTVNSTLGQGSTFLITLPVRINPHHEA